MRGEQVPLDALGDPFERVAIGALLLPAQPRGDPLRQLRAFDRPHGDDVAGAVDRRKPFARRARAVESGSAHQQARVVGEACGSVGERLADFLRRLAGPETQFDQAPAGEQRQRVGLCGERLHLEAAAGFEHLALVESLRAQRVAHRLRAFLHDQRFVAVDPDDRWHPARERAGEPVCSQLRHLPIAARRRSSC